LVQQCSVVEQYKLFKFETISNKIDIAFVSETWWTDSSIKNIYGYSLYQKPRVGGKGGGVCIYVNNNFLKSYEVTDQKYIPLLGNYSWCFISKGFQNILCGCIYRPPVHSKQDSDSELMKTLTSASRLKYNGVLICGDFNHTSIEWTSEGTPRIHGICIRKVFWIYSHETQVISTWDLKS